MNDATRRSGEPADGRARGSAWLAALALLGASACAGGSAGGIRGLPERTVGGQGLAMRAAGEARIEVEAAAQVATLPPAPRFPDGLGLAEALQAALSGHPRLREAEAGLDALSADALDAGQRPNPSLDVQVEDLGSTGGYSGPTGGQTTVMLLQTWERGGKRAARRGRSEAVLERERTALLALRHAVISRTRGDYYAALAAQGHVARVAEQLAELERFLDALDQRVAAGKASGVDRQQLGLLVTRVRLEERAALERDRSAKLRLAQLFEARVAIDRLAGEWPDPIAPPPLARLEEQWSGSVGQALLERELAIHTADVELAASDRRQDWTVSAGIRRRESTEDWTATVGVNLPIPVFDSGRHALEAARARKRQAVHRGDARQREALRELAQLHGRLSSTFAALSTLTGGALDEARWLRDSVREGYVQGRFELLQVLEAQTSYLDLAARHQDALAEHHAAWAELEGLLAQPIPTTEPGEMP